MRRRGFTSIELSLVVIGIAFLSMIIIAKQNTAPSSVEQRAAGNVAGVVAKGLSEYKSGKTRTSGTNWSYPNTLDINPVGQVCTSCFSKVIDGGVSNINWRKINDTTYVFNDGKEDHIYVYGPVDGRLSTPVCGTIDIPCCDGNTCFSPYVCFGDSCVRCGGIGQVCCSDNTCNHGSLCSLGSCVVCGGINQICCPENQCIEIHTTCKKGQCQCFADTDGCGCENKLCCTGNICYEPFNICVSGDCVHCGRLDEPCCAGGFCLAAYKCFGILCAKPLQ